MWSLLGSIFDKTKRQRAQRIMAFFRERETRDELGLGRSGIPSPITPFRARVRF